MTQVPETLWLTVSPHLKKFDQRLLCRLAKQTSLCRWEYFQSADEPCCLETPVQMLQDYIKDSDHKVNLIGHGLSGIVGLLYARRFPHRVKSLTLLAVHANPAVNWQAHYYALRQLLPCSREIVLAQMTRLLFGQQGYDMARMLIQVLKKDLDGGFALHSLVSRDHIAPGGVTVPLLVCLGGQDGVIDQSVDEQWQSKLKPTDQLWKCPEGHHFFHLNHAAPVSKAIGDFWNTLDQSGVPSDQECQLLDVV